MNESFLAANPGSSISAWLGAFDTFEALQPEVIVPAHGEIGTGELIPIQRALVERIRERALELRDEGLPIDEAATRVQAELQAEYPDWPRANGIAALARSAWNEAP
jgi:hypothetical protein